MAMLSLLLALCYENPPEPSGIHLQRASNYELWLILLSSWTSYWKFIRSNLRRQDGITVMWPESCLFTVIIIVIGIWAIPGRREISRALVVCFEYCPLLSWNPYQIMKKIFKVNISNFLGRREDNVSCRCGACLRGHWVAHICWH